jgi:GNAT superfamily N-acetyltransferase
MPTSKQLADALATFVRGFCATKSRTHPYEYTKLDGIWRLRDGDRKNADDYRKEEWIACGVTPELLDLVARRDTRGRYFICDLVPAGQSPDSHRESFRRLEYRLLITEPMFMHRLGSIPRGSQTAPAKIVRVRTEELAIRLGKAMRMRPMTRAELKDTAPFRQYAALDGDQIVGWVRSVDAGRSNWCSNLQVIPSHRRRGIAQALLRQMLRDDRRRGVATNVLLSSHAGATLYPKVGYDQIGVLYIYAPRREPRVRSER